MVDFKSAIRDRGGNPAAEVLPVEPATPTQGVPAIAREVVAAWLEVLDHLAALSDAEVGRVYLFGSFLDGDPGVRDRRTRKKAIGTFLSEAESRLGVSRSTFENDMETAWGSCAGAGGTEDAAECVESLDLPPGLTEMAIWVGISDIDGFAVLRPRDDSVEAAAEVAEQIANEYGVNPNELGGKVNRHLFREVSYPHLPTFSLEINTEFDPQVDNYVSWGD